MVLRGSLRLPVELVCGHVCGVHVCPSCCALKLFLVRTYSSYICTQSLMCGSASLPLACAPAILRVRCCGTGAFAAAGLGLLVKPGVAQDAAARRSWCAPAGASCCLVLAYFVLLNLALPLACLACVQTQHLTAVWRSQCAPAP